MALAATDGVTRNVIQERECKVALDKLKKCENKKEIPQEFEAMPPEVKMNAHVVKVALENCYDEYMPDLFAGIRAELKINEDVVKVALEKCSKFYIPELFVAMPPEVQVKADVLNMALKKCSRGVIPCLFEAMPPEVQMKADVAKAFLQKSKDNTIPWLFMVMPAELKMNEDVVTMAIQKCHKNLIAQLFKAMPAEGQMNEYVVKVFLKKCKRPEILRLAKAMNADSAKVALPNCNDEYLPHLFAGLPPEVKMNEDVAKAALLIPQLFKAIPAEVLVNEDLVKAALEKCPRDVIPQLFMAMPAEVQMNADFVKAALEKCIERDIPELFTAMTAEVRVNDAVVKTLLVRCYGSRIPRLFEVMTADVQTEGDDVKVALEGCNAYCLPALFEVIPIQWKMNDAVVTMAFKKCPEDVIPQLFMAMPAELKMNEDVLKMDDDEIPKLFRVMPAEVKTSSDVVKMAWTKCSGDGIPQLFSAMPDEVKTKPAVVKMALDKCRRLSIPQLFSAMPKEVKTNLAVVKMALRKCSGDGIPQLFSAMPDEVVALKERSPSTASKPAGRKKGICSCFSSAGLPDSKEDDVVELSIKKCDDDKIPQLLEAIIAQVKPNALKDYVLLAVHRLDASNFKALQDFQDFMTRLPPYLSNDRDIRSAFERKKLIVEKYHRLLWAAVKLSIIYLFVLGPIEGAIGFQRNAHGKIEKLSNQHWKNKFDYARVHFEIFDGCVLSAAPQPFDLAYPLIAVKQLVITAAFGFVSRDLMVQRNNPEHRWKVWVVVGTIVYFLLMIPISFISLVVHYVIEVSPQIHGGSFKKYECFYAIVNLGPFQTNYLTYLTRFLAGFNLSESAGLDMQRVREQLQAFLSRQLPRVAQETLVQPLLDDGITIGEMQEFKVKGQFILFSLTIAPYLCVETPFIITHKIPAAACFFPFIILIISVTGLMFAIVNRDFLRNFRISEGHERMECFKDWLKTVEDAGYMPIVPALWGLLVINEFLTLAPIYWYDGAGWFDSGIMVLVERSLEIYCFVLFTKITTKFWALFLNQSS